MREPAEARAPMAPDVLGAFAAVLALCAADLAGIVRRPPGVPMDVGLLLFLAIGVSLGGLLAAAMVLARGAVGRALSRAGPLGVALAGAIDAAALYSLGVHLQDPRALGAEARGLVLLASVALGGLAARLTHGSAGRGRAVAVAAIAAGLFVEHQLRWQEEVWLRLALDALWVSSGTFLLRPLLARFGGPRVAGAIALGAVVVLACAGAATARSASARRALWGRSSQVYGWAFVVGRALDRDRDGAVGWLGGRDCDPVRAGVFPGASERGGNGRDDNCRGGDGAPAVPRAPGARAPAARPPDLLLLSIDSLRWDVADHLTALPRAIGPHARFTRAVSPAAKTTGSLASIVRGRPVRQVRLERLAGVRGEAAWRDRSPTLGHALSARGYRVVAIPTDPSLDPRQGIAAGFESIYAANHEARGLGLAWTPFARERMRTAPGLAVLLRVARTTPGPLCGWIHAMEPHFPFRWGTTGEGPWSTAGLSRSVREVDRALARFVESFAQIRGRRPVVAIFGDHGEEIWEHGGSAHGSSVHAEQVRVGLWLAGPGVREGTWDAPVSAASVAPTLVELAGGEIPGSMTEPSLLPALAGHAPWPSLAVSEATAAGRGWTGYTGPRYRLLVEPEHELFELYDADHDPLERHDLAASHPAALREALREARAWDEAH